MQIDIDFRRDSFRQINETVSELLDKGHLIVDKLNQNGDLVIASQNDLLDREETGRSMYEHIAQHYRNGHLPRDISKRDVFRQVMDVVVLPTSGNGDLRSWELFWQFFFGCREFFCG